MNILPKKRWHVRTKENIARVRKDEAEAAEKERQERLRIENADREARLNVLKLKSKQRLEESGITETEQPETSIPQHINLFEDLDHAVNSTNKEHDKEIKEKKEEYEKKIGYLTYLGQDTNEALRKKNWYEVPPEASRFSRSNDIKVTYDKLVLKDEEGKPKSKDVDVKNGEVSWKAKQRLDPLNAFKKYCGEKVTVQPKPTISTHDNNTKLNERPKDKNVKKKHRKDKEEKERKLQKLREARFKREMEERRKTELFLTQLHEPNLGKPAEQGISKVKPKYNSQFNPELARQNYR